VTKNPDVQSYRHVFSARITKSLENTEHTEMDYGFTKLFSKG